MSSSVEDPDDGEADMSLLASIVIVTFHNSDFVEDCVETVLENDPRAVTVVDSDSTDGTVETVVSKFHGKCFVQTEEIGIYGARNKVGIQCIGLEDIGILNPLSKDESFIAIPKILTYEGGKFDNIGNSVRHSNLAITRRYAFLHGQVGVKAKLQAVADAFSKSVTGVCVDLQKLLTQGDCRITWGTLYVPPQVETAVKTTNALYEGNISTVGP